MPAVTRVGDIDDDFPPDATKTGSPTVFANSKSISRVGDIDDDFPPDAMKTGSPNVFADGE